MPLTREASVLATAQCSKVFRDLLRSTQYFGLIFRRALLASRLAGFLRLAGAP
jgi:predicted ABC-type exoprotein transport system permease subunit